MESAGRANGTQKLFSINCTARRTAVSCSLWIETNVIGHVKLLNRRSFTLVCRGAFAVPAPPPSNPLAHALAIFSSSSYHLARYSQAATITPTSATSSVLRTLRNTVQSNLSKGMETILPLSKITAGDSEWQNKNRPKELTSGLRKHLVAGAGFEPTTSGL